MWLSKSGLIEILYKIILTKFICIKTISTTVTEEKRTNTENSKCKSIMFEKKLKENIIIYNGDSLIKDHSPKE